MNFRCRESLYGSPGIVFGARAGLLEGKVFGRGASADLKVVVGPEGSVTAGNASGVSDGACALLLGGKA